MSKDAGLRCPTGCQARRCCAAPWRCQERPRPARPIDTRREPCGWWSRFRPAPHSQLPYDSLKDFAPVALCCATPNVLVVNPDVPARNLPEVLAQLEGQGVEPIGGSAAPRRAGRRRCRVDRASLGTPTPPARYRNAGLQRHSTPRCRTAPGRSATAGSGSP